MVLWVHVYLNFKVIPSNQFTVRICTSVNQHYLQCKSHCADMLLGMMRRSHGSALQKEEMNRKQLLFNSLPFR